MKIKIEAEGPLTTRELIIAIRSAVLRTETIELLDCYQAGENFTMNDDKRHIRIELTVIEPQKK